MRKYKVGIYKRTVDGLKLKGLFEDTCDTYKEANGDVMALNHNEKDDNIVYDVVTVEIFDALSARDDEIKADLLELFKTKSEVGGKTKDAVDELMPKYRKYIDDEIKNYLLFKLNEMASAGLFKRVFSPKYDEFIYKTKE